MQMQNIASISSSASRTGVLPGTIRSIQYLRGVAAVAVLIAHAFSLAADDRLPYLVLPGRFGVILFFVISGFVITVVTGHELFDPVTFARKRFVRVVPFYWLVTLATAAAALLAPSLFKRTVFDLVNLAKSLLFIPYYDVYAGRTPPPIQPLMKLGWTLNYEIFFYIAFALLFFLSARARAATLVIGFGLLYLAGLLFPSESAIWTFYSNHFILFFCLGVVIGLAYIDGHFARIGRGAALAMWLGAGVLAFVLGAWGITMPGVARDFAIGAMSGLLVCAALRTEIAGRLRDLPSLQLLGDASYSIYLVHLFWLGALGGVGRKLGMDDGLVTYLALVALGCVGGLASGIIVHRFIEKPLVAATQRLFGRAAPQRVVPTRN
jgi:exopolysaccharide production protein ExoZ